MSKCNDEITKFLSQYEGEWLVEFLFTAFGKYRYVHVLSESGLDCYLSSLRSVDQSHPDDVGCVSFYVTVTYSKGPPSIHLFNMVDFKDPDVFINTFKKYLNLKAFL